jgi:hypothetical protein
LELRGLSNLQRNVTELLQRYFSRILAGGSRISRGG